MKLKKKEKKLILQLVNSELYAQEQGTCIHYKQKRVDRLKSIRLKIGVGAAS